MARAKLGMGMMRAMKGTPSSYARGAMVGPFNLFRNPKKFYGEVMDAFHSGNVNDKARASARVLGTAAGITYVARAVKGQSPFKDKNKKRDVLPYIPGV